MNPVSLLTTATSDRIIDDPLVRRLCASMMEEAAQIGAAIGVPESPSVESVIEKIRTLGAFKMSMLQDLERGRSLEIDALVTAVQEIGRLTGTLTPIIDAVLALVQERGRTAQLYV